MKAFKKRPASYADLEALPSNLVGELVEGELFASPRPAVAHTNTSTGITSALRTRFQDGDGGPGGWWILMEPELHLGANVLVPDVAGWRKSRLARLPSAAAIDVAPDWLCEVLSPSTAGLDRMRKMPLYQRAGVSHVWLADPTARTIEAFRRTDAGWLLLGSYVGTGRVRIEPFEAEEFLLDSLWLDEEPPSAQ